MVEAKVATPEREILPRVRPMLPRAADKIPKDGRNWISENKVDGVRAIVYINKTTGQIRMQSKDGNAITEDFPEFNAGFESLAKDHSLILDGEIVYLKGLKRSNKMVKKRIGAGPPRTEFELDFLRCFYVVFDLLYLDGESLINLPILERKERLANLVSENFQIEYSMVVAPYAERYHQRVAAGTRRIGFEGIVLKRKDSSYIPGQSKYWLKIKFSEGKKPPKALRASSQLTG